MLPIGDDELTVIEDEIFEHITDEIVAHPTRDDWHEQRERGQMREAVVASHVTVVAIQMTISERRRGA